MPTPNAVKIDAKKLEEIKRHPWFLDAPQGAICEECDGEAVGTLFYLTGEAVLDHCVYDYLLCEKHIIDAYA